MGLVSVVCMIPQALIVEWDGKYCRCLDAELPYEVLVALYVETFVRFGLTALISTTILIASCYKIIQWVRSTLAEQLSDTWNILALPGTTKEQMEAFSRPQALSTNISHEDRPRWTFPDTMHQLTDDPKFASAPAPAPTATALTTAPTLTTVVPNSRALPPSTVATSVISAETAAATTTTTTSTTSANDRNALDTPLISTLTSNDADPFQTCPHCDRTFISRFSCVSHL
ncbi:hypothetical protein SprV_0401490800 [Sparganum proliferum]